MAEVRLKAERRGDTGKGAARKVRAAGRIPAILYGGGLEPVPIAVDRRELLTALHTDAGANVLLDLEIDGRTILALTKALQRHPVKHTVLHADFVQVERSQEVEVEVPVHLLGDAPGVEGGGVLEQQLHSVRLRCRVTDVPEHVDADVGRLQLGDSLRVSDLAEGRTFHILDDPESVVATIAVPTMVTEETREAAEEAEVAEGPEAAADEGAAPGAGAPEDTSGGG